MFDEGERNEKERISSMLTSGRVTDLLPKVLDDLSKTGLTTNTTANKLESKYTCFQPHFTLNYKMYHRRQVRNSWNG